MSSQSTERFDATIEAADRGGAFVVVPADVVEALGGGGRIKVVATFDGVEYRGSVVTMGSGHVIGALKSIRTQLGKSPGDSVTVTLRKDTAERTVVVPDDLRAALDEAAVAGAFATMSYTHRREYVAWIEEAKRPATRAKRIAKTIARLLR